MWISTGISLPSRRSASISVRRSRLVRDGSAANRSRAAEWSARYRSGTIRSATRRPTASELDQLDAEASKLHLVVQATEKF
jgi:hypothetical protein